MRHRQKLAKDPVNSETIPGLSRHNTLNTLKYTCNHSFHLNLFFHAQLENNLEESSSRRRYSKKLSREEKQGT